MANTTITPSSGAGFFTTDVRPFVASGAMALAGIASVLGLRIAPSVGAALFSGVAPMSGMVITPTIASMTLTGVAARLNLSITPAAASVTLSGVAATLVNGSVLSPLSGAVLASAGASGLGFQTVPLIGQVSFSGIAPVLKLAFTITSIAGSLSSTGLSPSLLMQIIRIPSTGTSAAQGYVPVVLGAARTVTPPSGNLQLNGTISSLARIVSCASGMLSLSSAPPRVTATISFSGPYLLPLNGPSPQVMFADYLLPEVA
jgi:hypothetical protein